MPLEQKQYPGHEAPGSVAVGSQEDVLGHFSGPPPNALRPSAFGNVGDQVPTALTGVLSDLRATMQETRNVMAQNLVMMQRIATMIGSGGAGAAPVVVNMDRGSTMPTAPGSALAGANLIIPGMNAPRPVAPSAASAADGGAGGWQSPPSLATRDEVIKSENVDRKSGLAAVEDFLAGNVIGKEEEERKGGGVGPSSVPNLIPNVVALGDLPGLIDPSHKPTNEDSPEDINRLNRERATKEHMLVRNALQHPSVQSIASLAKAHSGAFERVLGKTKFGGSVFGDSGALDILSDGGSLGEGLSAVAGIGGAAAIGGLAALPIVIPKIASVVSGYRNQGAEYQSVLGGSELGGLGQAFESKLFGIRNMFGMGDSQAQELFKGVTDLGITGGTRQSYLEFASHQFTQLGMSIAQSLKVITAAAAAGQTNLNGVAAALQNVSDAAGASGGNAQDARQTFINAYSSALNQGFGQQAAGIAAGQTSWISHLGGYANDGAITAAPVTFETAAREGAALGGLTPFQMMTRLQGSNGDYWSAKGSQALYHQNTSMFSSQLSPVFKYINGLKGSAPTQAEQTHIEALMNAAGFTYGGSNSELGNLLSLSGTNTNGTVPAQIAALYGLQRYNRGNNPEKQNNTFNQEAYLKNNQSTLISQMSGGAQVPTSYNPHGVYVNPRGVAAHEAYDYMTRTKHEDPRLQDVLTHYDPNQQFRVKENGKMVDISTIQAMNSDQAMAQIAAGTAKITSGIGKGESVAQWVQSLKDGAKTKNGKSGSGNDKGAAGKVIISAAPPLNSLLTFMTQGNVQYGNDLLGSQTPPSAYPAYPVSP